MELSKAKALYLKARKQYYNGSGEPIMSDAEFDALEDKIKKADPTWKELAKTGVKIKVKKVEVELPRFMPSLAKAYPEKLPGWLAKYGDEQLTMDKLDGSAVFLGFTKGKPTKLITRGDGVYGGDISFLIPHLKVPNLKKPATVDMRCEAVMPRALFTKRWATEFENPRNMVNGILNRALDGKPHPAIKDIHLVVLGVYGMPLEKGLRVAKANGLRTVPSAVLKGPGTNHYEKRLILRRDHSDYDMDGLVLAPRDFLFDYQSADKPKGTIAFKVNDEANATVVTVKSIIWQVTAHKRIIPKIQIEPTRMDGVTVTQATVHNAKWMLDRGIGVGAKVRVLRSGGVIPKIVGVVKAGKFSPPDIDYKLKGVHFVAVNADEETTQRVHVLRVLKFIRTMGIEFAADGIITQAAEAMPKLWGWLRAWNQGKLKAKLVAVGIGQKSAAKINAEFDRVLGGKVPAAKLLAALSVFDPGVGERKLKMLQDGGMALDYAMHDASAEEIGEIKGFSTKTAELILAGARAFRLLESDLDDWLDIDWSIPKAKPKKKGKLSGQRVTFTGYRDKAQEAKVEDAGGEIVPFGSKTTVLLYDPDGVPSTKVEKAKAKGIRVTTFKGLGV